MAWFHVVDPSGKAIVDSGRVMATLPDGRLRLAFKDEDGIERGIRVVNPAELKPSRLQIYDSWSAWRAAA